MATELVAIREAIAQIEATLNAPTATTSLLTVVEAAEELRVSRTRIFELLAAGHLEGVRLGRSRCVSRRSIDALLSRMGAG